MHRDIHVVHHELINLSCKLQDQITNDRGLMNVFVLFYCIDKKAFIYIKLNWICYI